jgi:threonine aldolase
MRALPLPAFSRITRKMNFSSDTAAPAHPAILAALTEANADPAPSYGADRWTRLAKQRLSDVFECELEMWLVPSGTAANALALAAMCPSAAAILCHAEAHIERDERGAPEFFTGGAKLSLLPGADAKIDLDALKKRLAANQPDFVHESPLRVLSLSNLTESGAAYSADEIAARASLAKAAGLMVHLDGARFANALASQAGSPAAMSWKAGVDVMSFGATKNGALGCEAILLFGEARKLVRDLEARAKRAGHMPPKMRFLGAQMAAYLEGGLWLDLAGRANASAQRLAGILTTKAGGRLVRPVDGNEIFVELPAESADSLKRAGASFYPWLDGSFRFVCSWATTPAEIDDAGRHLG